jgi:hypothetical protein
VTESYQKLIGVPKAITILSFNDSVTALKVQGVGLAGVNQGLIELHSCPFVSIRGFPKKLCETNETVKSGDIKP